MPAPQETLFGEKRSRARRWVPAPTVRRTFSRVLYDALAEVFDDLGFDIVEDDAFRDLVIARIVEPTSLLDVDRVLSDLGRVAASLSTRKRTLKRAHDGRYRDLIAKACFDHAVTHRAVYRLGPLRNSDQPSGRRCLTYHLTWVKLLSALGGRR